MASPMSVFVAVLVLQVPSVVGKGFLSEVGRLRSGVDAQVFQTELSEAMGMALGCGGHVGDKELSAIEQDLIPIWNSLQKSEDGRIERRTLRYLVHRFFDRRSALHIRGFEPSQPLNTSGWGEADVLSQRVPAFVEAVLESKHKSVSGFDLRDAALMVATIQQLVFDSESAILEKVYTAQHQSMSSSLDFHEVRRVLRDYLVHWLVGDDQESVSILLASESILEQSIPHWQKVVSMAEGLVRELEYRRRSDPRAALSDGSARSGHNALSSRFSFEDAHKIVGSITTSFAAYWESECQSMKAALVDMDSHGTGRVPLSKFYSKALGTEWRFAESESYLRELGALDETSWLGKQVIIPNYIQGTSNCIVSTSHYQVCCVNECEALMGELEIAVGGPKAKPSELLALVGKMNSQTSLDDDFPPARDSSLEKQLDQISVMHEGLVPLHGRLFAQWLHYVFPRECPFPHKVGSSAKLTPAEFGDDYLAEKADMKLHAEDINASGVMADMSRDQLQWMSQWSAEEELISEQAMAKLRPASRGFAAAGAFFLFAGFLGLAHAKGKSSSSTGSICAFEKSHFV